MDEQNAPKPILSNAIIVGGVLAIALAVAVDVVSTTPGIGPLQLLMIIFGAILILVGFLLRRFGANVLMMLGSVLFTVILLEIVLGLVGFTPTYTLPLVTNATSELDYAPFWVCDTDLGCRFNRDEIPPDYCDNPTGFEERTCHLNAQGYYDTSDFVSSPELQAANYRILILGDSFTAGASADYGSSYVEVLERNLQDEGVIVWNLGIGGTSTGQALALAEYYLPIMQPDLVVIGVYNNDLYENLFPLDLYVRPLIDGEYPYAYAYELTADLQTRRLNGTELYYRAHGVPAPNNQLEAYVRLTRIGSKLADFLTPSNRPTNELSASAQHTREYLAALQSTVGDTPLLVMQIPSREDLGAELTPEYATLQSIITDEQLLVLELRELLTTDDYAPLPDTHWNNEGHAVAAELLTNCIQEFMQTNSCELIAD